MPQPTEFQKRPTALQVVTWPIEKLIPYPRNARTHSEAQVTQIAASIVEFGFTNAILAGPDGIIIAGHARVAAARKLGMTEVPVIAEAPDRLPVYSDIGHDVNLRQTIHEAPAGFLDRRPIKITQAPTEHYQVPVAQRLVPEQHDAMIEPSPPDERKCGIVHVPEVDAFQFRADSSPCGDHFDRLGEASGFRLPFRTLTHGNRQATRSLGQMSDYITTPASRANRPRESSRADCSAPGAPAFLSQIEYLDAGLQKSLLSPGVKAVLPAQSCDVRFGTQPPGRSRFVAIGRQ